MTQQHVLFQWILRHPYTPFVYAHSGKYDFLNIVKTNIPLRFKENILISIFISLIAGLRDQIVKNTGKYR